MTTSNVFVFVVCGAREHIDTLHFSLRALRKFSNNSIVVVTDTTRNEIQVEHDWVINIHTPEKYNHHQASIYLKTGLHKFLSKGYRYCYLDTDVVALDDNVSAIFDQYVAPVPFATDHCRIQAFSPSAVNCGCIENFGSDNERIAQFYIDVENQNQAHQVYVRNSINEINELVKRSKKDKFTYTFHRFKYLLPGRFYHLNDQYKLDKKTGAWYDVKDIQLTHSYKHTITEIERITGFKYNSEREEWSRADGSSLARLACLHLADKIKDKFGTTVSDHHWNHWNGGVFLFDDLSTDFLEYWHRSTLEIFEDKEWRTRDQGTLIATAWRFSLQGHKTLPIQFNFIADYNSDSIQYEGNLRFSIKGKVKDLHPHFIHIYHHWGDESWQVWQDVKNHVDQ